ncbi:bifunctional tRNA (5-methylaminomethyl-2-thiouridine)(34)-methyltransferase MnmD/FAD-dependent 5-carboxymethylaminomethyl-2-thiouridine(34) oxidoreductase MnmC [Thiomicrorhabdus sp. 6S2-11]|uniref:tRNA 5-methylaminomethyl-2-thiouridine biosynthesis bifunctional protein MnmC n=1 Tax=Thiomicrorhabdus marina TaxID=2818442 RepID=A0ABS3Q6Y7_9GAMM|nr:bifunctional tRNA (5-methylaminomethyl-2-thiouridine)(34)-methyltransferase MnmD/FAD-dependent 5-carboxymethylaminomethyl-2-thiouridine(34) oxidoreductase MnmC [Thiomicrorhabdus marina]MBO1928082.1 bifunctional tRNA (5-methylaminomethyl-2-thiouridine)(34)-methyltransferase MnmD/FAD-dependent 5-carboxymethylaminomethyl-2-thiouridine(34) oxidoreductase MnmC [Thiomicrorhabdus marina]
MKKIALQPAQLHWQEEVPFASEFEDSYFSQQDGLNETRYNFLQHNQLAERFAELAVENKSVFRIAESGFGSGLNFLAALQLWQERWGDKTPNAELHFVSFEKFPLRFADLQRVHQSFAEVSQQAELLQQIYPPLLPGWHDLYLPGLKVRLSLWLGDIQDGFKECDQNAKVDAWFLDGFAPSKNPQMWQPALFQNMARLSHQDTTFATFTAAGIVRRGLKEVGFEVKKDKGFGRKREMCFGKMAHLRPHSDKTPWFSVPKLQSEPKTAIVVGAGIAGATTAYALAEKGMQVTVLEQADDIASQASGNLAGTMHPLITADWNLRSRWYWAGYQTALRWLKPWLAEGKVQGDLSGLIQLAQADGKLQKHWQQAFERVAVPETVAQWLDDTAVQEKLAMQNCPAGLFYPDSGWIYPRSIVETCLAHQNVKVLCQNQVESWQYQSAQWQVQTNQQHFSADVLVFASASLDAEINAQLQTPMRPVKGQVSHLRAEQVQMPLPIAVTHGGYASPTSSGHYVAGATFEAPDIGIELSDAGHQHNIEQAQKNLPNWLQDNAVQKQELSEGRIAFRPTTPDHLPVVGAVPDWNYLSENYLQKSHTKAVFQYPQQHYQPHLYISNGHGARGLISVFLAAEIITAQVFNQALPLAQSLYYASHPARFQIRTWRSGKA